MRNREGFFGGVLAIAFWAAILIGWIMNFYKFTQCDFDTPMKAEVLRGIGIVVFPAGAVMGYMDIKDK